MMRRLDSPRAEGMEEDLLRIGRLIRVELVKQVITRMLWVDELQHLTPKHFDLFRIEQLNAGHVALFSIELQLFLTQPEPIKTIRVESRKEISYRAIVL